jgi:hypothetical protein
MFKVSGRYDFNCERRGRFMNVAGAAPYMDVNDDQNPIEEPSPPQSTNPPISNQYSPREATNRNRKSDSDDAKGMMRGAIAHGSLGKIVGGLASSGYFTGVTEEEVVASIIYIAKALELWYKEG